MTFHIEIISKRNVEFNVPDSGVSVQHVDGCVALIFQHLVERKDVPEKFFITVLLIGNNEEEHVICRGN